MHLRRLAVSLAILCAALGQTSLARAAQGYFRYPTLAGDQVVFTAECDLWSAPLAGGRASRLTTHPAEETNAVASPDGKWLAFTAAYDGPPEVYVMQITGGVPRRVTFDGTRSIPVGWTSTGEVLYVGQSPIGPSGERTVTAVHPASLERHPIPLADANDAAIGPDGKVIYVTRFGLANSGDNVRVYRGGLLASLWRFGLDGKSEATKLADPDPAAPLSNDRRPMPWGDRIYFISDRDGHANLWSMNADGGDRRQLTHQESFDIRGASLDQGRIVYQLGADLHLYDIAGGQDRALAIDLVSDFDQERRRLVKNPLEYFDNASFAPDGERVAVTARGHVALMSLAKRRRVDVSTPSVSRVREAVVSPDGLWVYAILEGGTTGSLKPDDTDAPQIWRLPADGTPEWKQLTTDDAGHRVKLVLSPDGKLLAHTAIDGRLFLLDLDTGDNQLIDSAPNADLGALAWSADSRHLAFVRSDSDLMRGQLFLYEPASKTKQRLTSDRYESKDPAFTPDGKWLYFLSDRHFESSNRAPWGDRNMGPFFDRRTQIYALALQAGEHFPFQPKDELTPAKPAEKEPADKPAAGADKAKPAEAGPEIEWTGLADRLFEVPVAAGDYSGLATDGKRLYFLESPGSEQHTALKSVAIDDEGGKPEEFLGDTREFALSADRKKLFIRRWADDDKIGDMFILETGTKAPSELGKATVRAGDWTLTIDPRTEWRQLFDDAWRLHRDYYYDRNMHDVDWLAVRTKYAPLVARVTDRDELNDVLAQMLAELGTLHSQIRPGDLRTAQDAGKPGFLGAVLGREPNGTRILHIYRTDRELPSERSPLARPGVDAREGDLIVAVNGLPPGSADDMAALLNGAVGSQVLLTLTRAEPPAKDGQGPRPKFRQIKTVVTPVDAAQNGRLRYSDWEEGRRQAVEQAGGGKIGYLHLRAMGKDDIAGFARDFYAQIDRDGLIIDVRHNNGGNIDSWVIEKLLRRAWAYWQPRYGTAHETNMQQTFRGRLAVLIDETTYSDGESFAAGIKALALAPLIGRRTAGAGIWLSDENGLADRGMARVAQNPQFSVGTGEWLVENKGVDPDIAVENPPNATFKGGDAQLDAAVGVILKKLETDPVKKL
jgi:tricorn protease